MTSKNKLERFPRSTKIYFIIHFSSKNPKEYTNGDQEGMRCDDEIYANDDYVHQNSNQFGLRKRENKTFTKTSSSSLRSAGILSNRPSDLYIIFFCYLSICHLIFPLWIYIKRSSGVGIFTFFEQKGRCRVCQKL